MQFKDRVVKTVNQYAEVLQQPKGSAINFLSYHHGNMKAFRVKAHGILSKDLLHDLENYQRNTNIPVFIVSEQADHIPRFEALNRYLRWRARMKEKNNNKNGK